MAITVPEIFALLPQFLALVEKAKTVDTTTQASELDKVLTVAQAVFPDFCAFVKAVEAAAKS